MSFLKFFWKDFLADQSYNTFTILCASLGIIGLLLVESFKVGIEEKISNNAKNFMASDLTISSRRVLDQNEKITIENYLLKNQLHFAQWTETYSLVTKVEKTDGNSKLANLNFISEEFPFYGGVTLEGEGKIGPRNINWQRLHTYPKAWIARDFSWQLGVNKGDSLKIGEVTFTVDGIITEDNFSSFRGFNLAPKIFISSHFLMKTALIKFGSTATYTYAIQLNKVEQLKKTQQDLSILIPDRSVKILSSRESSVQVSRSYQMLGDYLSLITLTTYLLSLIGLYYFTQHFLSKKLKTLSIYKALGLKTSFLFLINFTHLIVLTSISVIASTTFVVFIQPLVQKIFSTLSGEDLYFALSPFSIGRILTLSLFGSLLALGPLFLGALQTPVALVFKDLPAELKRIKYYYFIPLLIYIIALTIILANSFKLAGLFLLAFTLIVVMGALCFKIVTIILDKSAWRLNFINRHAMKALSRYFTSSFTIFICLLIGMTLTSFIIQLEESLRAELNHTYGNKKPDLFMFDLQDNQAEQFLKISQDEKWNLTMFAPMVRGRLLKINNELVSKREVPQESNYANREAEDSERMKNRGVNLSYREKLSWSEKVVEGKFNGKKCDPLLSVCEISLDQSYAKRMGTKLGDKLIFDISGSNIEGIVTSMRSVKWTSFEPNFFILFQPGILEEAPKTYLSSFKVRNPDEKKMIFTKIVKTFSNVSILEVSEILRKITSLFDLMAMAIEVIAKLSLFVALIVLVAVTFNHLDLRKYEMNLFFILGLDNKRIKKIFTREFYFLVILCLFISQIMAMILTFSVMKFIFASETIFSSTRLFVLISLLCILLLSIIQFRVHHLLKRKSLYTSS